MLCMVSTSVRMARISTTGTGFNKKDAGQLTSGSEGTGNDLATPLGVVAL